MKDTHFLYSIATLTLGSIIAIFVGYGTNTLPMHTPRHSRPILTRTPTLKDCSCCVKLTPQELTASRQHIEKLRRQQQDYKRATELLKQYGAKEGFRLIKQFSPEIASQLESFITRTKE